MKKDLKFLLVILTSISLFFSSGCRDVKEIQHLNYATAIGVDYKDGKYYSYIQFVSFEGIARTEGQTTEGSVWVSEAVADSFEEAFFVVYKTAQERILWGHVTTILLSETALKQGFDSIFDSLTRYYEFRLTPWVFGTKDSVKEVLSTPGFFGQTVLDTIIHEPQRIYEQSSEIRPIKLHQLAREIYEPGETTFVPSITIDKATWEKDLKKDPKLALNGAFFIQNEHYMGFHSLNDLGGIRWLSPETIRVAIPVPDEKNIYFEVVFEYPLSDVEVLLVDGDPKFNINLELTGYFVHRNINKIMKLEDIEKETKEVITVEIQEMYQLGVGKGVDFYNLEHELFRKEYPTWQRLKENDDPILTENSIQSINIDMTIKHTGIMKNESVDIKDIQ
ncbi:Ger(x)C family spore germination protein [Alkalihalobacterium elongatum]|uniref:Ger(x)C family spore germination protein n=1 Tax=Alkalihalobacterium elongatum TaxID=2675466 RepID=UPI001C1F9603|nr:Ger(x)C family spore germination protein [Alkalihalobacterium elongatum]